MNLKIFSLHKLLIFSIFQDLTELGFNKAAGLMNNRLNVCIQRNPGLACGTVPGLNRPLVLSENYFVLVGEMVYMKYHINFLLQVTAIKVFLNGYIPLFKTQVALG